MATFEYAVLTSELLFVLLKKYISKAHLRKIYANF